MSKESIWRYQRGSWSQMESPIEFEDEEGELLETPAGYSARTRWFGEENEFAVEVYSADSEAPEQAPAPYLAIVYNVGDNIERILVDDFPSLIQLLREMEPALDTNNFVWDADEMDEFLDDEDEE